MHIRSFKVKDARSAQPPAVVVLDKRPFPENSLEGAPEIYLQKGHGRR